MCMCIRRSRSRRARRSTSSLCLWPTSRVSSTESQASLLAEVRDCLQDRDFCAWYQHLRLHWDHLASMCCIGLNAAMSGGCRPDCNACMQVPTLNRWRWGST